MQGENNISVQVNSFGGISFVMAKMKQLGMPELFDSVLGTRVKQARYSYSDVFLGWIYCNLCGAKRIEDIYTENLHNTFRQIPIVRLCSPDSIARIFKRFAAPTEKHINSHKGSNTEHEFNSNLLLNDLLLQFSKSLGTLNETEQYLIDYDATTVPVEKTDAKMTYKGIRGYSPGVAMIGKIPVHIEGRNGNTPAAYKVTQGLNAMYERLQHHNIKTWGIRMDAASYQQDVIELLVNKQQKFYIRVANTEEMKSDFDLARWKDTEMHKFRKEEIASVEFQPIKHLPTFRFVVMRFLRGETRNGKDYMYRGIITNDMETYRHPITGVNMYVRSDEDVVRLYDQRGDAENNFRDLLNDFNWKRVPFSYMNENMVFMYVSAMAKILFEYLLKQFADQSDALKGKFKLKKFVAHFVRRVSVQWLQQGDSWTLELLNLKEKFEALQSWAIRK